MLLASVAASIRTYCQTPPSHVYRCPVIETVLDCLSTPGLPYGCPAHLSHPTRIRDSTFSEWRQHSLDPASFDWFPIVELVPADECSRQVSKMRSRTIFGRITWSSVKQQCEAQSQPWRLMRSDLCRRARSKSNASASPQAGSTVSWRGLGFPRGFRTQNDTPRLTRASPMSSLQRCDQQKGGLVASDWLPGSNTGTSNKDSGERRDGNLTGEPSRSLGNHWRRNETVHEATGKPRTLICSY
jgi:hypothetical protein